MVGYQIGRLKPIGQPFALTVSRASPRLSIHLVHSLGLDDAGEHLTTIRSSYQLSNAATDEPVVTYDYARDPPNEYPEAHLHIQGEAVAIQDMLERCGRRKDKPDDLHFPVGGRRFRPCLEDLIEFCILERLVTPRNGWSAALNKSRNRFLDAQLRAAVRRFPESAATELRSQGWRVAAPDGG